MGCGLDQRTGHGLDAVVPILFFFFSFLIWRLIKFQSRYRGLAAGNVGLAVGVAQDVWRQGGVRAEFGAGQMGGGSNYSYTQYG